MRVVILGASTALGGHLVAACAARGDEPVALVRGPQHGDRLLALGAETVLVGSAQDARAVLSAVFEDADALVVAAGTGTTEKSPAQLFAAAAERTGKHRYLMVSNWYGAKDQPWSEAEKAAYLEAKQAAERDVRGRALDWTIVRTGRLTDAPVGGRVHLGPIADGVAPEGEIGRADVAAAVVALISRRTALGRTLGLTGGDRPLARAVEEMEG